MSDAEDLLADVSALRRRARIDRHAHWLPLLFFGFAIVASAPLHVQEITDLRQYPDGSRSYVVMVDPRLSSYWAVVLMGGALLTAWWYRRQGTRSGIEGRIGPPLVAATLFLMTYTVLSALPGTRSFLWPLLWPLWLGNDMALLVIAVGLLALAVQERSRGLWFTAVAYLGAAVLANWPNTRGLLTLGFAGSGIDARRFELLPPLVLPTLVLLAGGSVAALQSRRHLPLRDPAT